MPNIAIKVENLAKAYQLGQIVTGITALFLFAGIVIFNKVEKTFVDTV